MIKLGDMQFKFFVDEKGYRCNQAMVSGQRFSNQLSDVYFDLKIGDDGRLSIIMEEECRPFYSRKLDVIYNGIKEVILDAINNGDNIFYLKKTFKYAQLKPWVKSSIENKKWESVSIPQDLLTC